MDVPHDYRAAVAERQRVVCGPHRELTRALLDEIAAKTQPAAAFVPKGPYTAGCAITVRGRLGEDAIVHEAPSIAAAST